MKSKIFILLSVFIFMMTLGLKDAMAAAATDVVCKNPCINAFEIQDGQVTSSDIADGAVTNTKISDGAVTNGKISDSAVTNTKIQDGAVTDAKITGPITASKIQQGSGSGLNADLLDGMDSSTFSKKPANVIVVAKSGGDFTSIQAAIDSINPTADNPYLIKVMPGTYTENITMKSYIYSRGSGREVTTIQSPTISSTVITLSGLTGVAIAGFTIEGGRLGIYNNSSSPTIMENTIKGHENGISNLSSSSPTISRNIITENTSEGIYNVSSSPTISENIITRNGRIGIMSYWSAPAISGNIITDNSDMGIYNYDSSPMISGNTIAENTVYGIYNGGISSPTIIHNKITGNGGTTYQDISVDSTSTPNISFNVYDTIYGTSGVGMYNVKSDGTPAIEP